MKITNKNDTVVLIPVEHNKGKCRHPAPQKNLAHHNPKITKQQHK